MDTFHRYQRFAMVTANTKIPRKEQLINGTLGLAGEAGEVADLVKKHFFQGHPLNRPVLIDELGDVLWYIALLCDCLGIGMEQVALGNINKLRGRYPEGFEEERSLNRVEEDNQ